LNLEQEAELDHGLMNFAVDQSLAQSIFRIISTSKPAYSPPLERVSLELDLLKYIRFNCLEPNTHLQDVLTYIGRPWTCTRNPRDDKPHDCFVTKHNPADESRDWIFNKDSDRPLHMYDFALAQSISRIWPAARTKGWMQVWHSFELDTAEWVQTASLFVRTTSEVLKFFQPFYHVFNKATAHPLSHCDRFYSGNCPRCSGTETR
jgi:hypothetical protein